MDPASIIGLTAAIQQIVKAIYRFGHGVAESKKEINQLCSELLALKAALEHVQINLSFSHGPKSEAPNVAPQSLVSTNLSTPEFKAMISSAETILKELLARLDTKPGAFKASLQRLTWPLIKDDVQRYVERLHRLTSWFVLATTSDNLVICRESYNKISSIENILQQQVTAQRRQKNAETRKVIRDWLAPFDPGRFYQRSLDLVLEGTGSWFLDGAFENWLVRKGPPVIWLRARPGAGKTTLLSAAIRRARSVLQNQKDDPPVAFFYCSFSNQETQDPRTIMASLLDQICDNRPALWDEVDEQYLNSKHQVRYAAGNMSVEEGLKVLTRGAAKASGAYLFLDALNESKQWHKALAVVKNLLEKIPSVRIMISSTEELDDLFETDEVIVVPMKRGSISQDIEDYIETWIENDSHLVLLPNKLKLEISSTLMRNHDGVFRWVQCQLEALTRKRTPKEIRNALADVPTTLAETYRGILTRIPAEDVDTAKEILFWVSSAVMPMTLEELCEAVIVGDDQTVINDDVRLLNPKGTLELCGSLISYDSSTTRVSLAHSSVLEYLRSKDVRNSKAGAFYLDLEVAYHTVPRRCINYLLLPDFRSGCCSTENDLDQRLQNWPLLTYIAFTLFDHLEYVDLHDPALNEHILRFFATHHLPRGGNFGAWVQAFNPITTFNIESCTPLYYAARFGLVRLVNLILETQGTTDLEKPGGVFGSTPLHVASWAERPRVVRALLDAGANVKETNFNRENALYWAVKLGNKTIERILREAGATLDEVSLKELIAQVIYGDD